MGHTIVIFPLYIYTEFVTIEKYTRKSKGLKKINSFGKRYFQIPWNYRELQSTVNNTCLKFLQRKGSLHSIYLSSSYQFISKDNKV